MGLGERMNLEKTMDDYPSSINCSPLPAGGCALVGPHKKWTLYLIDDDLSKIHCRPEVQLSTKIPLGSLSKVQVSPGSSQ